MKRIVPRSQHRVISRQKGFALLLVLLLVGAASSSVLLSYITPFAQNINSDKVTAAALAQARDALIGRAATDANRPGSLPCPDLITDIPGNNVPNDGIADLLVGNDCPSYIGRLPWRTLGLPDLRDGSGERLWYALSSTLRDDNSAQPINSDTPGLLTIVGTSPMTNVVAIVFAPGTLLDPQVRDIANENNVVNYLEGENANGDNIYTTGMTSDSYNDRIFGITSDALFQAVEYRVAREIRANLAAYFATNLYYPFANSYTDNTYGCTPLLTRGRIPNPGNYLISINCPGLADWPLTSRPPAWFVANNWHLLAYYTLAPACANTSLSCTGAGFLTVNNTQVPNNNKHALIIVAGRVLSGQSRPCAGVTDCLEDSENTNLDDIYVKNPISTDFNDKFVVVAP